MKHYISNEIDIELWKGDFNIEAMRQSIVSYLLENIEGCAYHYKEADQTKYVGDELINIYRNNMKGHPCKVGQHGLIPLALS